VVDSEFVEPTAKRLAVAEAPETQPIEADAHSNTCIAVPDFAEPIGKRRSTIVRGVFLKLLRHDL